jgi:hypothetical protein
MWMKPVANTTPPPRHESRKKAQTATPVELLWQDSTLLCPEDLPTGLATHKGEIIHFWRYESEKQLLKGRRVLTVAAEQPPQNHCNRAENISALKVIERSTQIGLSGKDKRQKPSERADGKNTKQCGNPQLIALFSRR